MKFSEYPYERPSIEAYEQHMQHFLEAFSAAANADEQADLMMGINKLRSEFSTMQTIASIRHTIDTTDAFYEGEQSYYDEIGPVLEKYGTEFYTRLLASPYRAALEARFGAQLFRLAEMQLRTFSDAVMEDLKQENRLSTEYGKLMSSAKIMFEGEERTLSQLTPFQQSPDRALRQAAYAARIAFMTEHEAELDRIYDELVAVRTRIAHTLGFKNYVELGYLRLARGDYNAEMVAAYREQILQHVVPVVTRLKQRQEARIGVDKLRYYDESLQFTDGNAIPQGDADFIVQAGKRMYDELSAETSEFFSFMLEHELMDLVSRKGKRGGGYCTFIDEYSAPFIFSNFNGTSGDIDVLTHEAGHAFQVYSARGYSIPEYHWPTMESAEIHSMSMEFFTWPWMESFFGEQTQKYKFSHLAGTLLFLPYGVAVDEFQHFVYEHPEATAAARKAAWREIERKYLPHRDYAGFEYLEQGGFWHQQGHIYHTPFYYIDYTLAQVCALQFWKRMHEDRDAAWADYVRLCKEGGSKSFLELVEVAGLKSPFSAGCVESVIPDIERWLDAVDDKAL
ncbi:MAG: M3 family oligoendopeptidase [Firmicutes bacterium]|nr:M3 family oligoendopeptidase [Bacillota bacterium]